MDDLILAFALGHLPGADGATVLDAGCGDGFYAGALRRAGLTVNGVDTTPALLERARQDHPGVDFVQADLISLPFSTHHFDAVFCLTVLEWLPDPLAALQELKRVARPGAPLVLGVLGAGNRTRDLHTARFWGESPMNGLLPWELPTLCERLALRVTASQGVTREGAISGGRDAMTRAMIWLCVAQTPHD
ncbi:class I SAM-dependent methyltransferase [Deinococcus peraridilitoris]|uniref:class I SAM-dependent methyltransferase n=1 Tax=Deinococcus peraridilitoris TaxID=432329 RepID=UPI0012F828C1|nr:class I SAM-dependent methyltransferase [Deinococcus peraridilitoris]